MARRKKPSAKSSDSVPNTGATVRRQTQYAALAKEKRERSQAENLAAISRAKKLTTRRKALKSLESVVYTAPRHRTKTTTPAPKVEADQRSADAVGAATVGRNKKTNKQAALARPRNNQLIQRKQCHTRPLNSRGNGTGRKFTGKYCK